LPKANKQPQFAATAVCSNRSLQQPQFAANWVCQVKERRIYIPRAALLFSWWHSHHFNGLQGSLVDSATQTFPRRP
jgi:hypothetical protein